MQELQTLIDAKPKPSERPIINSGWHIVLCEPNVEIQVSIALNVRGYESFCPAEHRPQRTNRTKNGRRVYEDRAKAMIPGYNFVRFEYRKWDFEGVKAVRGVRGFMKVADRHGDMVPAGLSGADIERLRAEDEAAFVRHQALMAKRATDEADRIAGKPEVEFEAGKQVRIDGPTGERWVGVMVRQRGSSRVELLRANAKIIVPHSKIHNLCE
ncbi:transcription termination/antitermination protein NusG [uncultured Bradyrhizobium sp.]|uniref:transcription termination/antitermination protein NusG n=1 Tax=uncultured Bradyrhizobium sp. TaxID=199684 RepID=UPI0035CA0DE3